MIFAIFLVIFCICPFGETVEVSVRPLLSPKDTGLLLELARGNRDGKDGKIADLERARALYTSAICQGSGKAMRDAIYDLAVLYREGILDGSTESSDLGALGLRPVPANSGNQGDEVNDESCGLVSHEASDESPSMAQSHFSGWYTVAQRIRRPSSGPEGAGFLLTLGAAELGHPEVRPVHKHLEPLYCLHY